jgi:hypothetical protein
MTLIPLSQTPDAAKPQTHAIVIGVGDYPHLRGGSLYDAAASPVTMGLKQLTSPVVSATAFANWLVTKHSNPAAPLGSVELLLSPGDYQPPGEDAPRVTVETATMQNIQNAFDRWYERCDTLNGKAHDAAKDNVGIFYFCGHGVEYEVLALLPEDFGASKNRPWDTSIDFTKTWYGMGDCKAKTQCYFIDACREASIDTLKSKGFSPRPLKTSQSLSFPPRAAPILYATPSGQTAQGPPHSVSYFTEGLIKTFDGLGGDRKVGVKWKVTPDSLAKAMIHLMSKLKHPCATGGTSNIPSVIHEVHDPARSLVYISCRPSQALGVAELSMRKAAATTPQYQRTPQVDPWEHEVETGTYDIEVKFSNGEYSNGALSGEIVYPPFYECELEVQ